MCAVDESMTPTVTRESNAAPILGRRFTLQLFAVLVAARQLRTALFAREIRKIPHTEASSPGYILGSMR